MTSYGKLSFYRVVDVIFDRNVLDVPVNDEHPTLKDYYKSKYNLEITKEKQPLLQVENKIQRKFNTGNEEKVTYLIPEFCQMTGIPDDFDEFRRKKISEQTIRPAKEKFHEILEFIKKLKNKGEIENLRKMGIEISDIMNKFIALLLNNPTLELGSGKTVEKGKESFFNLFANPIFQAKHNIDVVILHTKYA